MHLSFSFTTNEPIIVTDELEGQQQDTSDGPKLKQIMNLISTILGKLQVLQKNVVSTTTASVETVVTDSMNSLSVDKTDYHAMRKWFFITLCFFGAVIFLMFLNSIKHRNLMGMFTSIGSRNDPVSGIHTHASTDTKPDSHILSPHPMFHMKSQKQ